MPRIAARGDRGIVCCKPTIATTRTTYSYTPAAKNCSVQQVVQAAAALCKTFAPPSTCLRSTRRLFSNASHKIILLYAIKLCSRCSPEDKQE
jgi:hypothetical protein